jgi:outer membrane receptor protein involved in Fe transport
MKRIRQSIFCLTILTVAVCLGAVALNAQTSTEGSIAGTVMDPSGAVVSGVAVTIHNLGTNAEIKLTSDASGFYKAPLLEPGTYRVTFAANGFATYRADNVIVQVGQPTDVSPRLTVGASTTSVEVTETAPVLNLESPDFTASLNLRELQSIPINNRRWSSLAMTTPGVVSNSSGYGLVSVRGISELLNNVEIDGADDNDAFYAEERGRTREAYSTAGAAVREFQVNTGVYSAEYGRAAGGVITSVTKSGTNQLHGQAYFWDRESNWNAMNDFSFITTPSGASVRFKPEDLRKIYGFTVGGALIKDKLFWIYTYDQHTHVFPGVGVPYNQLVYHAMPSAPITITASNPAMPAGESCNTTTGLLTVPAGGAGSINDYDVCALAARQGVSYNQAAYDWTVMMLGNANVPLPTGLTAITDLGMYSDLSVVPRIGYQEINTPKLDWQINPKEHLSVLYHRLRWDAPGDVQTSSSASYGIDCWGNDFVKLDYGVTKLTSLITTNVSNELLYQYGRELLDETNHSPSPYTLADVQSSSGNIPQSTTSYNDGFAIGAEYYGFEKALPLEQKWQVDDVLYWNHGNHSMKFGVDLVHNNDFQNNLKWIEGYFSYNWFGTYMNDELNKKNGLTPAQVTSGNLGCDSNGQENYTTSTITGPYPCYYEFEQGLGGQTFAINTMDTGIFAQDNWKFSPRLTLELGLRWDYEALPPPISSLNTAATANGVTFVPYTGLLNNPSDKYNFGPRIGFSYDVFGKGNTVVRGGYGLYYGRITNGNLLNARISTGSPYGQITPVFFGNTSGAPQFPNILSGSAKTITPTSYFLSPFLRDPEVQEYDLMVQHHLGHGTYIQASYLGAVGRELPNYLDVNLNPTTTLKTITISDASGLGPLGPTGTTYTTSVYTAYGNTNLFGTAAADYTSITELVSNINSNYNAAVLEVLNRSLHSIQFDVNYTWSHALDFSQNAATGGAVSDWYDPYANPRVNYGDSAYNVPYRVVAYALYTFPNVKSTNWVKYLVNDWSVNDSFQAQSGLPYTAGVSSKPSGAITSGWNGSGGSSVIPAIGRNTYKYPRKMVDDVRIQKQISFKSGYNLQLMLNAFNVANHQNVDGYSSTSAYSLSGTTAYYMGQTGTYSGFGVVNSSNNSSFLYTPRQVEIAARFNF